jgi:hypothetical protein
MGSLKKVVKKVAKPEVILPLAAIAIGGPALAGAMKGTAAGGALFGKAATGIAPTALATTGGGTLPILRSAGLAAAKGTPGLFGFGGAMAPLKGTLAKGIATGLANPFSKAGLATYGSAGLGLASLMGKEKTEAQKNLGVDAQAQYDLARLMNQKMGGAYTDEELNTLVAPMLSQYGGEYETFTGPKRKRRPMFPGLNYSGLTRYAADGGSIMPIARDLPDPLSDNEPDMETLQGIKDYIDYLDDMDAAREAMAERVPNPTGRADGGLMQLAGSAGDRPTMEDADEHSFRLFNKPYKELTIDELDEFEEEMDRLRSKFMADGGSIPQTKDIPNGMQLDGRGGGFIPMGAKERKDDVPAMLAKNEFVMTADAVRAAGGGDVNKGAQKMYDLMNNLESKV